MSDLLHALAPKAWFLFCLKVWGAVILGLILSAGVAGAAGFLMLVWEVVTEDDSDE